MTPQPVTERERIVAFDLLTASVEQLLVLERMSHGYGFPIADVAADTGVPVEKCRRIMRSFREAGIADYGPFYDEDEGLIRGSGYYLSRAGAAERKSALRLVDWRALERGDHIKDQP